MARAVILIGLMAAALTACGSAHRAGTTAPRVKDPAPALHPPGPIPGYLLIADRGNNRMLLVDSKHHIFWRYPGGGRRAMPFVFDDDTFFGPNYDRIISNQEDQDTIQVISFPGKHVLWRYGHVNVKSGGSGYLNDAYLLLAASSLSPPRTRSCRSTARPASASTTRRSTSAP
ncbi:MAG TPA: hypothetical protein VJP39_05775 [Gaiellaceae bacterium]|nr:hypothetical protein [Gaiellaceae bacterium]